MERFSIRARIGEIDSLENDLGGGARLPVIELRELLPRLIGGQPEENEEVPHIEVALVDLGRGVEHLLEALLSATDHQHQHGHVAEGDLTSHRLVGDGDVATIKGQRRQNPCREHRPEGLANHSSVLVVESLLVVAVPSKQEAAERKQLDFLYECLSKKRFLEVVGPPLVEGPLHLDPEHLRCGPGLRDELR